MPQVVLQVVFCSRVPDREAGGAEPQPGPSFAEPAPCSGLLLARFAHFHKVTVWSMPFQGTTCFEFDKGAYGLVDIYVIFPESFSKP